MIDSIIIVGQVLKFGLYVSDVILIITKLDSTAHPHEKGHVPVSDPLLPLACIV